MLDGTSPMKRTWMVASSDRAWKARLARNRADDVEINRAFEEAGVRLVSTSENSDQTPGGMLLHGIMSSIAEFYSRNLANEVIKGMGEKARNGGTLGKAPLGYINVRARDENGREIRTIALDEARAPLIRLAFTEYATGQWTTKRLAAHLHDRGLTTVPTARKPAKAVTGAQLHRMLRHPYYKGVIFFQGVEYAGAHEPLVDEETWSQVQAVLDSHRFGERERQHNHHLKTTVYCGLCGARLLVQNTRNSKGDLYPYFICARRQRTHDCAFRAVLIDVVEERMSDLYQTIQLSSQDRQLVEQYVREELRRLERDKDRTIRSLTTRRTNIEDKRRRLMHAHYEGAVPLELLKEEQTQLTSELDHIERQLTAYQADITEVRQRLTQALDLLEDCHRLYQAAPPHLKKLLNQVFFERVLVNPAVDEEGRVVLPDNGTNDGRGRSMADAAAGDCPIGENDGPLQRAAAPRLLADASSDANLAADLRRPFDWLASRRMHNVAHHRSATLLQDNPQENWDNQLDCPVNNTVCNDEALTSGGERFASSSTNPDRVTHDLGLGKAIVVHLGSINPNNWLPLLAFRKRLIAGEVTPESSTSSVASTVEGGETATVRGIRKTACRPISAAKKKQILSLEPTGMSARAIARQIGTSTSTVKAVCRQAKQPPRRKRRFTDDDLRRAQQLYAQGHTYIEIGLELGFGRDTVSKHLAAAQA